jgi:hypothetical protein
MDFLLLWKIVFIYFFFPLCIYWLLLAFMLYTEPSNEEKKKKRNLKCSNQKEENAKEQTTEELLSEETVDAGSTNAEVDSFFEAVSTNDSLDDSSDDDTIAEELIDKLFWEPTEGPEPDKKTQ